MKSTPLLFGLAGAVSVAAAAAVIALLPVGDATRAAYAQPTIVPEACVCSDSINLAGQGGGTSFLRNCQCGALQCVVHVGSGELACR